jgi:hypothetical protein
MDWFSTDKEGLAALLDRRGRHRVLVEPIANALDEDGVTTVAITLTPIEGRRGAFAFSIEDNATTGFRRLSDAWTMFASSYKKADATKRGRFNLGDKLFLALCESARITSTTGTVVFDANGRHTPDETRPRGSRFDAVVRMTRRDVDRGVALIRSLIVPSGITVTLNDDPLSHRSPVHTFEATLPTEFQDDRGEWHDSARRTVVALYEPAEDERPHIYEMGIPVVREPDTRWHVDVAQKVPLNMDRDNVTPGYLRRLRQSVLDNTVELIDAEDANSKWVKDALPTASPEAVGAVLDLRYGERRVVADPSDPEANKLAVAAGYTVIPPRAFSRGEWDRIREHDLAKPAGQVTPSQRGPKAGREAVAEPEWRPGMRHVADYARLVGRALLGAEIAVTFHTPPLSESWLATFGSLHLSFNVTRLGYAWFEHPDEAAVDELLIHELGHHYCGDHLDRRYHDALCRLGAAMKRHAAELSLGAADPT